MSYNITLHDLYNTILYKYNFNKWWYDIHSISMCNKNTNTCWHCIHIELMTTNIWRAIIFILFSWNINIHVCCMNRIWRLVTTNTCQTHNLCFYMRAKLCTLCLNAYKQSHSRQCIPVLCGFYVVAEGTTTVHASQ